MITLDPAFPIWDRVYTVAPLVVVGTKEGKNYDLAPKHLAMPLGWSNYFGFVCTPRHKTYHNAKREGGFTVSYPRPDQVVMASLAASPRCGSPGKKPIVSNLNTVPAEMIDGVLLEESYLWLECSLDRIIDGFGVNSLIVGQVLTAKADPRIMKTSDYDDQDLLGEAPMLAYLPPDRFSELNESYSFPFPANFEK